MDQIYANNFSVGTIGNTVHLTIRTLTPMYNETGRCGNQIAKEIVVIMTPESFFGLRDLLKDVDKKEEPKEPEETE